MAAIWMRRTLLATACASAALLAACGSSSTESALNPDRMIAFGDGMADVGQKGSAYTVNDGTVVNWTAQVASRYNTKLTAASAGGLSYAQGNARINATPDAAGNSATPTVKQQIDTFLASKTFAPNDLVFLSAGVSDSIVNVNAFLKGEITEAQMYDNVAQAGKDLATQAQRLVTAGASHVVMTGTYDLSRSPWAKAIDKEVLAGQVSRHLNEALLVAIVNMGKNVAYIDMAYYVNIFQGSPGGYGFTNSLNPVCTSVDAGPGIGIGANEVNSSLCNTSTLVADANPTRYVFADKIYITPSAHRQFGDYAYDRLRVRW